MTNIKTFKISDELFSGYTVHIDMDYFDTLEDVCAQIKRTLIIFLEQHNLEILKGKAKQLKLHYHDYNLGQVLMEDRGRDFWVCSHC
jgi:hypothetical protein